MEFEWDPEKAASNFEKHDVSFEQAMTVFEDPAARIFDDPDHSDAEQRSLLLGHASHGQILVVSYTIREEAIRIISAREADSAESRVYASQP